MEDEGGGAVDHLRPGGGDGPKRGAAFHLGREADREPREIRDSRARAESFPCQEFWKINF